jgi:hypothetical protein
MRNPVAPGGKAIAGSIADGHRAGIVAGQIEVAVLVGTTIPGIETADSRGVNAAGWHVCVTGCGTAEIAITATATLARENDAGPPGHINIAAV